MADSSPIQTSFNGGIFSPLLEGHIDSPRIGPSYSDSTNLIALKQGPLVRRGGTVVVFEQRFLSDSRTKVVDFIFNDEQAYILAFSKSNLRIYRNDSIVFDTSLNQTVTGITKTSPPRVTVADASAYTGGKFGVITGLSEATELNNVCFAAQNISGTQFDMFEGDGTTPLAAPDNAEVSGTGLAQLTFSLTFPYTLESYLFDADNFFSSFLSGFSSFFSLSLMIISP